MPPKVADQRTAANARQSARFKRRQVTQFNKNSDEMIACAGLAMPSISSRSMRRHHVGAHHASAIAERLAQAVMQAAHRRNGCRARLRDRGSAGPLQLACGFETGVLQGGGARLVHADMDGEFGHAGTLCTPAKEKQRFVMGDGRFDIVMEPGDPDRRT